MKLFAKTALAALMLAGATALTATPAAAHVSIGIGIGGGYYAPPSYSYCDRYSRRYDPYRCDDYDGYYDSYSGPIFINGYWLNGPFRSRFHSGRHEFFWHDGWHGGSGFHRDGFRFGDFDHHRGWGDHHGEWHHDGYRH